MTLQDHSTSRPIHFVFHAKWSELPNEKSKVTTQKALTGSEIAKSLVETIESMPALHTAISEDRVALIFVAYRHVAIPAGHRADLSDLDRFLKAEVAEIIKSKSTSNGRYLLPLFRADLNFAIR